MAQAGVTGYTRDQDALEKASSQKAEFDHKKGLTLQVRHCLSLVFALPFVYKTMPFLATLQEHSEIVEKTRLEVRRRRRRRRRRRSHPRIPGQTALGSPAPPREPPVPSRCQRVGA